MDHSEQSGRKLWITHEVERTKGENAQQSNIVAGKALAEAVRTTLGPKGRDKMLIGSDGKVVVTNDGASILSRLDIEDPIAKILENIASLQDQTCGDGTTTATLLTGELLTKAETLLEHGLHPTTIVEGYQQASVHAREQLPKYGIEVGIDDDEILRDVARTAVTGKWDADSADWFANLATSGAMAAESEGDIDLQRLTLKSYPGGGLRDSELLNGILVDMETSSTTVEGFDSDLPQTIDDVRIAVVDKELTPEKPDAVGSVTVDDPQQLKQLQEYEEKTRNDILKAIFKEDVDVLLCQKSIGDIIRRRLAREGILTVERTRQDELDSLARATDATPVRSIDELGPGVVGYAESVERRAVGETQLLIVSGCPDQEQSSLLLRGGTPHVAEETRRIVEDCLSVIQLAVQQKHLLPGGGAVEMALARDLETFAESVSSREQLAIEAFSEALEEVPRTLALNAGRNPLDAVLALRNDHHAGNERMGIGVERSPQDMVAKGVLEPLPILNRSLFTALEATALVLRVDDNITIPTSEDGETSDRHDHGSGDRYMRESTSGYPWAIGH